MAQTDSKSNSSGDGKAILFFERAEQVAETGNWDFAIEMYLQGIQREPGNIERGHQALRNVALKRKALGGKGPGLMDRLTRKGGKTPVEALINAEYLLAKEPGSVHYLVQMLEAARKLEQRELTIWICEILLDTQRKSPKKNFRILTLLIETFDAIEEYTQALQACEIAHEVSPTNQSIQDAMNELSAKYTIQKGKYGQDGDFVKGVKDMDKQKELAQRDSLVKDRSYLEDQIEKALSEYEQSPTVQGKVNAVVDALLKIEEESFENRAIDILAKAYEDTGVYQFKMRIGDIRIRQMTRRYRQLTAAGDKAGAARLLKEQLAFEMDEFIQRAANYPTDLAIKFELGRRQFLAGKLDDAIASFQQAQRDPRRHLAAMTYLGRAFAKKGWYSEAADTYARALETDMSEERAKELRYNFGDVLEQLGSLHKAEQQFSTVAQTDFNYKDIRERLENVRKKIQNEPEQ